MQGGTAQAQLRRAQQNDTPQQRNDVLKLLHSASGAWPMETSEQVGNRQLAAAAADSSAEGSRPRSPQP
jgi:hypothetical protein